MRATVLCTLLAALTVAGGGCQRLKVLVVTGGHDFEQEPFFKVFKENPGITLTAATQGKSAEAYDRDDLLTYDVIVAYDMAQNITDAQKQKLLAALDRGVGFVVMHHGIGSFQEWPEYEKIIGAQYFLSEKTIDGVKWARSGYQHDVDLTVKIVARDHPITAGLKDFAIHDEIYWGYRVNPDVKPLITTDHPKSGKPLGWCHQYRKARVVYLQLGHDHAAYENPSYQQLVARSIKWAAHR